MKTKLHLTRSLALLAFVVFMMMPGRGWGQTTIFTESMGTVASNTTIASHETANGFDNDAYTMTSGGATNPADIRATSTSSGYTGASGLANVYFTATNAAYGFAIEGIDASTYTSLTVQFGYRKETSPALPTLVLDYWNGTSYVNVPFTFNEAANATVAWYLSPVINLPSGAQISTLKLRWVKSGTVAARIDDIVIKGSAGAPTITLSSPSQVGTGTVNQSATSVILSQFQAAVTTANATLNSIAFTSAGTYIAGDISNFKLWYNNSNTISGATQIGTTITSSLGGGSHIFSSLTQAINSGSTGYFFITCDIAASPTSGNAINVAADPVLTFASGTPTGSISVGGSQTITVIVPDIAISSPNPAVAASNITQGTNNNVIYRFDNVVTKANAKISGLQVTTTGTYSASDLTNLKAWYSSDATFSSGSDILLSTKTTSLGTGLQVFPSWTNQLISNGTTGYIFITTDIPCAATAGNNIAVNAVTTSDVSFVSGTKSGSTSDGGTQSIVIATPANVTGYSASVANAQSVLIWTNPTGCFDEIMIVAKAGSVVTAIPTGDGTSYSANLAFGSGDAYDGGSIVYKGSTSPQTITALSNGTTYYYTFFTRKGPSWSTGVTANATPAVQTYNVGDYGFTTSGNWGTTNANWKQWDGSGWNTTPSGVPAITDNVFILNGKTCTVEVSGKSCKNLMVETNGKLYTNNTTMVTPRYVNVGGNITCNGTIGNGAGSDDVISFNISGGITSTISGSGVFTANRVRRNSGAGILNLIIAMNIELRYNGDALYNATATPDATQAFNVTINAGKFADLTGNGATPTAGYALKSVDAGSIYGKLTVTGTLANAGTASSLVIKSDASGTGSLINATASVPATVNCYITGVSQAWHLLSSPVASQAITTAFTAELSTDYDFFTWYEPDGVWVNFKNTTVAPTWETANGSTNFTAGKGYLVEYTGTGLTKQFTGNLNAGAVSPALSKTGAGSYAAYNLVGNPYPSAIDWKAASGWTRTSLVGSDIAGYDMSIWNDVAGNYCSYNSAGSSGINGGTQYIAIGQGFFVKAELAGTLGMGNGIRVHNTQNFLKSTDAIVNMLRMKVSGNANTYSDEIVIEFEHPTAYGGAEKMFSFYETAPSLYTVKPEGNYSIDFRGEPGALTIPLSFKAGADGNYTLAASQLESFAPSAAITLEDLKEAKTQDLMKNPSYTFSASKNDESARFLLHFGGTFGVGDVEKQPFTVHASGNSVYVTDQSGNCLKGKVQVYNMMGQLITQQALTGDNLTKINLNAGTGYYLVKVTAGNSVFTGKVFINP